MREIYLNSKTARDTARPDKIEPGSATQDKVLTPRPVNWTIIIVAAIVCGSVIETTNIARQWSSRPVKSEVATKSEVTSEIKSTSEVRPVATPAPIDPPVQRALPVEPVVRRGLPVEGQLYLIQMGDRNLLIRFMGAVPNFDALPKQPNLYDYYKVASSGHDWIFMQPAGFAAPAWVDP